MLKISEAKSGQPSITLRLEGRVVGPWVGELRTICEPLLNNGRRLVLDLTEVSFADENGVAVLTRFSRQGVRLVNPTPFVEEQLKASLAGRGTQ